MHQLLSCARLEALDDGPSGPKLTELGCRKRHLSLQEIFGGAAILFSVRCPTGSDDRDNQDGGEGRQTATHEVILRAAAAVR